ncbi:MFS transporter [Chryseobacterium sp. Ch-15]|uniref:MFS transporter n=1 Tax=Chryseobacterium muglaense TaxID=2893752 RepID=A0A9Q3UU18_9FLAO|nr:MFS transporter [Chryseobacterium muglaense]MBD3906057.1 MFS transporter [Chryseobacterium muglaense]MCC9033005.1 MFS transporter [Chryseobacterium muglaense]MCM2556894.1 MFS transporter [Chryseobacterium muglaense]
MNKRIIPKLSFWQIWNMNVGFFGIQYSFGLQQTAVNPLYSFLGAHAEQLPILNLAGPVTGLLIQPLIGAISDKTWSVKWGRRKPFFLLGAVFCSLALFVFPFSSSIWMAVGLLWILDAANNTAMEPYRAFIGDKLPEEQQTYGFQMQSLFVGAGITLANLSLFFFQKYLGGSSESGGIPAWVYYSFFLGSFCSIASVVWSVYKTPEIPPTDQELVILKAEKVNDTVLTPFTDIFKAIVQMPKILWQLALVYLFQWYALFCYWQFATPMIKQTLYHVSESDEEKAKQVMTLSKSISETSPDQIEWAKNILHLVEKAVGQTGLMNGFYNFVTMLSALLLIPLAVKYSSKSVYAMCLFGTGLSLFILPFVNNEYLILLPMVLFGIGWAAMMGLPYSMVSPAIPSNKRGVYMGVINMMIVIPMLIQTVSFGFIYKNLLGSNPSNAILLAGLLFILASVSVIFIKVRYRD